MAHEKERAFIEELRKVCKKHHTMALMSNEAIEDFLSTLPEEKEEKPPRSKYYIKVTSDHDCFIADCEGDPGRTLVFENAKFFDVYYNAFIECDELKKKYPQREFEVFKHNV